MAFLLFSRQICIQESSRKIRFLLFLNHPLVRLAEVANFYCWGSEISLNWCRWEHFSNSVSYRILYLFSKNVFVTLFCTTQRLDLDPKIIRILNSITVGYDERKFTEQCWFKKIFHTFFYNFLYQRHVQDFSCWCRASTTLFILIFSWHTVYCLKLTLCSILFCICCTWNFFSLKSRVGKL